MSICCILMKTLAVILLATYVTSQELNSTLYSTIYGASVAFSNENITFTCIARGSNHMGWSSEQYIGTGGRRLEFISTNMPGTMRTSRETLAVLVSATVDEFIISRLYIRVQPTIPIASVQCQNIGAGTMTSITFQLAGNDTSITCDRQSVCPGESVTCVCTTGSSGTLAWVTDGNRRLEFTSSDPPLTRRNVTGSSAFGILTDGYNENRIEVITSNFTVTASVDDTSLLTMCENVDRSTSNAALIPVLQNCPGPSNEVTTPPGTEPASSTSGGPNIAAIVIAVIFVVFMILFLCAVAFTLWKWRVLKNEVIEKGSEITMLTDEINLLKREISTKDTEINDTKMEIFTKDTEISHMKSVIGRKEKETSSLNAQIRQLKSVIGKKEEETSRVNAQIGQLNATITRNNGEISCLNVENQHLKTELAKLKTEKKTLGPAADESSSTSYYTPHGSISSLEKAAQSSSPSARHGGAGFHSTRKDTFNGTRKETFHGTRKDTSRRL